MKGQGANRRPKMNIVAAQAMLASMFGNDATTPPRPERARFFGATRMQTSRYMPHQGVQEKDRRVRQMANKTHRYPNG